MGKQTLVPRDGVSNPDRDVVLTPRPLAAAIIKHFAPQGRVLDPCRGEGAFYDQFPADCEKYWLELSKGLNFLLPIPSEFAWMAKVDWVVSNPPWSQWREFTQRAMAVSDNIVWLCLVNALFMKARLRDMEQAGFGIKEILLVPTPLPPWPQAGFALAACHIKRGHKGPIEFSKLTI